jgi:hypothetical protein
MASQSDKRLLNDRKFFGLNGTQVHQEAVGFDASDDGWPVVTQTGLDLNGADQG